MRVVSLNCSNTEIVCALGCAQLLVGVDNHSDFPAEVVAGLPRVGPDLGIDIDAVMRLEPDLVLASLTVPGHEKVLAGLARSGLNYFAPEPVSLQDVYRDVREIAGRLGVADRGAEVVVDMQAHMAPRPVPAAPPSLLVQWWPKPVIAPGAKSWLDDLLRLAGATHPLADETVKSRPLSFDEIRAADPDAIVISWCGVKPEKYRPEVVYRNPEFARLRAVRKRRVYCVPEAHLGRPSPRLGEGYRALARIIEELAGRGD